MVFSIRNIEKRKLIFAFILLSGFFANSSYASAATERKAPFATLSSAYLDENPNVVCLGAAARDPLNQPCINPQLRLSVFPSPTGAQVGQGATLHNALCDSSAVRQEGRLTICNFGVPVSQAKRQVVIIGDSHANRWRTGLYKAAIQRGWNVSSIVNWGCRFSTTEISDYGSGQATVQIMCRSVTSTE